MALGYWPEPTNLFKQVSLPIFHGQEIGQPRLLGVFVLGKLK